MAVVWKNLAHPNVVPLLGVTTDPIQLVSGWMPDADLTGCIANHPDADRLSLVGVSLLLYCVTCLPLPQLSDVAKGLNYLHSCEVVHGDLKGVRDHS